METETRSFEEIRTDLLAERLADGDPLASRDLVRLHYGGLYRYAFAMLREAGAAEDAVHDAFERAFRALGSYPEERLRAMTLRPWLYRITLNVVRNGVRKQQREVPVAEVHTMPVTDERRDEALDALDGLASLPERQRTALTLRYLQDLPYKDISAATGWPENTAKTLVRRGLFRLRKILEEGG